MFVWRKNAQHNMVLPRPRVNNGQEQCMQEIPDRKPDGDGVQQAVSRRLARLATMPVDTSRLDAELRRRINRRRPRKWLWFATPLAGVAAALAVMVLLLSSGTPRLSAADLAGVYSHLTAAGQQFNEAGAMTMPMNCRLMPGETAGCCRQLVDHRSVACVVIKTHLSQPVVMVMCNVKNAGMPSGRVVTIAGHAEVLSRSGDINMVMRRVNKHWFCAMGRQKPSVLAGFLDRTARR